MIFSTVNTHFPQVGALDAIPDLVQGWCGSTSLQGGLFICNTWDDTGHRPRSSAFLHQASVLVHETNKRVALRVAEMFLQIRRASFTPFFFFSSYCGSAPGRSSIRPCPHPPPSAGRFCCACSMTKSGSGADSSSLPKRSCSILGVFNSATPAIAG